MPDPLKVYSCLTNSHTKVIQFSFSKTFPVMVECGVRGDCDYKKESDHRRGKTVCSQAGQMDEKTFLGIERRNSIPTNPA